MATTLTEKETQILATAWQCFDSEPHVDFVKLAGIMGYENPRSVSNAMAKIKKKLAQIAGGGDGGNDINDNHSAPTTPKTKNNKAKADSAVKTHNTPNKRKTTHDIDPNATEADDTDVEKWDDGDQKIVKISGNASMGKSGTTNSKASGGPKAKKVKTEQSGETEVTATRKLFPNLNVHKDKDGDERADNPPDAESVRALRSRSNTPTPSHGSKTSSARNAKKARAKPAPIKEEPEEDEGI